jgi:CheY-like chemotaxis protein
VSIRSFPTSDDIDNAISERRNEKPTTEQQIRLQKLRREMNILLVEDNLINQKVMLKLLSHFPCKVDLANNGTEGVNIALRRHFDLILMDMIMPEMDGLEATRIIRGNDSRTPIIALTANATTDDRDKCLKAGMNDFISKPISMDALMEVLSTVSKNMLENEVSASVRLQQQRLISIER